MIRRLVGSPPTTAPSRLATDIRTGARRRASIFLWHNSTPLAELGRALVSANTPVNKITQAKNHLNQFMTMEQLLEAEQRAAEWIRKMRKIPPSSIDNPPNASTA